MLCFLQFVFCKFQPLRILGSCILDICRLHVLQFAPQEYILGPCILDFCRLHVLQFAPQEMQRLQRT